MKRAAFAAAFLFLTAAASPASAQLTVTPITWDVVGLDHNRPLTAGPELFPSGARVCSAVATTNVEVDFVWTDGNGSGWDFGPGDPYINLRPGSLTSLDFAAIGAGECVDAYFEVRVTRSAAAFGQSRDYSIVATDGNGSASSPEPRQILVEQLVSQNRNTTTQIRYGQQVDESDWVTLGYGGSINLAIGNTYFLELTTETSTSYEELQSFLTLSNTIFQVLGASTTYTTLTAPPSRVPVPNPGLWADGCEWDSDPDSPNYSSCLSTGKAGGVVVTRYEILIISGGGDSVSLNAMIYDRSGSSFHYNADFSTPQGDLVTYDPAGSLLAKRFVPDTIGLGGTSRLRFTITNPNPVGISGYNFLDELPAGVLVASPSNASTTCGGTVTAVPGTDEIALAGGFVGAGGSCTVLVDVTAAAAGTYNNVSQNLFIGEADTGNNATATLTVSATDPPVLVCDENATLAYWRFPTGASATAPAPTSNLVTATAAAGSGLVPVISTQTVVAGTNSWASDNIATGALNTANQEYFEFTIDTTGLDSITLDFASRRTSQGPMSVQLYYGATGTETVSSVYSLPAQNTWYSQGPTVLSTGLNSSGNTVFRLYVYSSTQNNNGHNIYIDDVRFRGLYCSEVPPPPPTGANPPTIAKNFSPTPIGVGHESTLTFTIANPNPATALTGIAFSDELPFGMSVVPATFGGTCTGFWGTDPGDSGVLLHSGGSLAGNASCTLTVDVTSSTVGTALNISDPIYATESGYNTNLTPGQGIAQASLVVLASPGIAKEFIPNLLLLGVTPNDASTLTFTITNPNPDDAIGGVSFTDSLPAGLEVASPPNAATSGCGAPTWSPAATDTSLSFSGGSIAAGDACTVTVDVTGPVGLYDNVSSAATHIVSGEPASNGEVAEASLQIDEPIPGVAVLKLAGPGSDPDLDPWSDYVAVLPGGDVFYKIVVENTGEVPLTGLVVSDPDVDTSGCVWPNPLPVADVFDNHIATCIVGPVVAIAGTHDNTATAEANSSAGPVDDSDTATYATVVLSFSKVADPLTYITAGDIIDYTFTLTNSGAAILAGPVTLTDPLVPGATCASLATVGNLDGFLDPGESVECSGSYTIQAIDVTNGSVTNTAYASVGGFDSPTDSATVTSTCAPGPCCVSGSYLPAGTTCRAAAGVCDTAETCTGSSSECPADGFVAAATECRASAGVCDVAEACTGSSAACPADGFVSAATTCRASAGVCDLAETCTGSSAACPADGVATAGTSCRVSAGVCDVAETCDGSAVTCPADGFVAAATECRASAGVCDVAEACTGSSAACPADGVATAGTSCRASAGVCDVAETCDGSAVTCPADGFVAAATECRASAGVCDVAEACTGSSAACPADGVATAGTSCRASAGVCDVAETCDGSAVTCPADGFVAAATECRASAGVCDVAEACTGSSADCPVDGVATAGTSCRVSAGVCDVAETCDGSAVTCPADGFVAAATECRASAGVCDVAEACTGASADCPVDGVATAGTSCRVSAGVCDVAETCDGSAVTCPADGFVAAATECRASAGVCDVAEACTGSSAACPADGVATAGTSCRASAGVCDVAETCDGSAVTCPADGFVAAATECRASAGVCDVAEACTGSSAACPVDGVATAGTSCRVSAGVCDVAETCDGSAVTCPADGFVAAATECRASAGVCDVAEACTGSSAACPADGVATAGTSCRASAGVCDVAETCDGSAVTCPADGFVAAATECRASAGVCDVAEACTGSSAACPADGVATAGTSCRASAGVCDVAETCDGSAVTCPADGFVAAATTCRAAAGDCDLAETCTGSAAACPADSQAPAATPCGDPSDTACDNPDTCDGAGLCLVNNDPFGASCLTTSIGDRLWLDENGDGIQDAGEDGIAGVLVELYDSTGTTLLGTALTDVDGRYVFSGIAAGTYVVRVDSTTLAAGLAANPTYDFDSGTVAPDGETSVTVVGGETSDVADFGYNWVDPTDSSNPGPGATGAIGDRLWNDADGDGVQDFGEAGIEGVTVRLLTDDNGDGIYGGGGDNPALTTATDAAGNYIFDGIAAGAYVIDVVTASLPAGFLPAPTGDPDSDGDNTSDPIVLAPGDVYLGGDFGYGLPTGSTIGQAIYLDANGDGTRDPGEPGLPGVTVVLLDNGGNVIASTVTDANGSYSFPGLPDGTYSVLVTDTAGILSDTPTNTGDPDGGSDRTGTIVLAGADNLVQDFGFAPSGHAPGDGLIGNTIFLDRDASGTADPGEGLEGVSVNLFDSTGTTLIASVTTDANGGYVFGGLDATETYVVRVDTSTLPGGGAGLSNTVDPDGAFDDEASVDLTLFAGGVTLIQDFAYEATTPNTIGGTLWDDTDGNGVLDGGEADRFAGVLVVLRDADGNVVATTTTDASGNYQFAGLPDGTYTVDVAEDGNVLGGLAKSSGPVPGADGNSQAESYTVTVSGGVTDNSGDFGYFPVGAAIGNFVWSDTNGDGIQDLGEPGLAGVVVTLTITYPNGDVTTLVAVTDAQGAYSFGNLLLDEDFDGLGAGEPAYSISAVTPGGHTPGPVGAGGDPQSDSNDPSGSSATPAQGVTDTTNDALAGNGIDFGFTPLACTVDADCDDGLFCNGVETCVANACTAGADPCLGGDSCGNVCNEAADNCVVTAGTECRASAGVCDLAETCDGLSTACPADGFVSAATTCRGSAGVCDVAETCTGSSAACPIDGFVPAATTCRGAVGVCDVAETCTGSSSACPADGFASSGTACGDPTDSDCNNPDTCDGAGVCVDRFEPSSTACSDGLFCTSTSGVPGTTDNCNGLGNGSAACVSAPVDCDDALFCTGPESCNEGTDQCDSLGDPCAGTTCNTCQEGADTCFDPAATACGDPSDTACDNPDTCDGAGTCQVNNDPGAPTCVIADVAVTKVDLTGPVQVQSFTTYSITVTNLGPEIATNVVVTDTLDPNTTFVTATIGSCSEGPVGVLVCDLGDMAAMDSRTFEVVVYIGAGAPTASALTGPSCPGGQDVCNAVSVTTDSQDSDPANNDAEVATDVVPATVFSELSVLKSDTVVEPVAPGASISYEIEVSNAGTADAADVVVYETLDPFTTYVSDTAGCVATDVGSPTGTKLTCPVGTVAANTSASFTVVVTVLAGAPETSVLEDGDCDSSEDVCNEVVATTSSSDVNVTDNDDSEPTNVLSPVNCGNGVLNAGEQCDPPSAELCGNTIDDDGDMLIDCGDPDCAVPGFESCDGNCQLVAPCVPILDDPAYLRSNFVKVHGRYIPTTPANPFVDGFTFMVSNENGEVYKATLLPGDLKETGKTRKRWKFRDHGAKDGVGIRGGLYRVLIKRRTEPDGTFSYPFFVTAYGDMSKATVPGMTTQVYIGNDRGFLTVDWLGKPGRWYLTHAQAENGR